jgi:hypothetical protein
MEWPERTAPPAGLNRLADRRGLGGAPQPAEPEAAGVVAAIRMDDASAVPNLSASRCGFVNQ